MLDSMPPFRFKCWIHDNNHLNKQEPTCTGWSRPGKQAADQDWYQSFRGPDESTFKAISAGWMLVPGHWNSLTHRDRFPPGLERQRASQLPPPLAPPTRRVTLDVRCGACDSTRRICYQLIIALLFLFIHFLLLPYTARRHFPTMCRYLPIKMSIYASGSPCLRNKLTRLQVTQQMMNFTVLSNKEPSRGY